MKFIICSFFLLLSVSSFSQEMDYSIDRIPAELKKNAISVVRMDHKKLSVLGKNQAILEVKYAVTIFDQNAYERAIFSEDYDKFIKIKNIKITIYDGQGNVAKKLKNDDIIDGSLSMDAGELVDNRLKYADPDYKFFPFTIEYLYDVSINGFMSFPSWTPFGNFEEAVENSTLEVITSGGVKFKYLEINGAPKVNINKIGSDVIYNWKMSNLPAREYEPFSDYSSTFPMVLLAPEEYEMEGYAGTNATWNDFAKWIATLNAGRNNLSAESQAAIQSLVADIPDKKGKVEVLYKHLQGKTRYISIQLGIGGWQPFEADKVERLGYGDCKALTNYMKSMLEVADIPSNYVLVRAGENAPNIINSFPSNQFNHAFLMVPIENDTIWLECTSQQVPFGMMGTFTDDRDVLVIQENGGKIVRTPSYSVEQNYQKRTALVKLSESGEAIAKIRTEYRGARFMDAFPYLLNEKEDVKKALYKEIDIQDFSIDDCVYKQDDNQTLTENLNLKINSLAKVSQQNLILPLNLMNKISKIPPKKESRTSEVFVRRSFKEEDIISYEIPDNYHVGTQPEEINISSKFGSYYSSLTESDGRLEYRRILTINKGRFPVSEYGEFVDFLSKIAKADRMKVLLSST